MKDMSEIEKNVEAKLVDNLRTQACSLKQLGKYREAIEILQEAMVFQVDISGVYSDIGGVYFKLGLFDKGTEFLLAAVEYDPENIFAEQLLTTYYLRKCDYKCARYFASKLIEKDKLLIHQVADLYRLAKKNSDANFVKKIENLDIFNSALPNKRIKNLIKAGDFSSVEEHIRNMLNREDVVPKKKQKLYSDLIKIYLEQERFEEALSIAYVGTKEFPESFYLLVKYIRICLQVDCKSKAVPVLEKGLYIHKHNVNVWEVAMQLYDHLGDEKNVKRSLTNLERIVQYSKEQNLNRYRHDLDVYIRCLRYVGKHEMADYYNNLQDDESY